MHPCQLEQGPQITNLAREQNRMQGTHSFGHSSVVALVGPGCWPLATSFLPSAERPLIATEPCMPFLTR